MKEINDPEGRSYMYNYGNLLKFEDGSYFCFITPKLVYKLEGDKTYWIEDYSILPDELKQILRDEIRSINKIPL